MAKSYANKYNPDKTGKTTKYRNQGYSGNIYKNKSSEFNYSKEIQKERLDQREESYSKWLESENRITKQQLKEEPHDQLGSVASSWLTSLGYNTATGEAVATFKGSRAEFYYKMDYETFLEWKNSPSKGRWLHDHPEIMGSYSDRGNSTGKFENRISNFYKTDSDSRKRINTVSIHVARAKARQERLKKPKWG